MKLRLLVRAINSKPTNCKSRLSHIVFSKLFTKMLSFVEMKNPKLYQHAQTQHGDGGVIDLENIVLCKGNLCVSSSHDNTEAKNSINLNRSESDSHLEKVCKNNHNSLGCNISESECSQSVWFFDVDAGYFAQSDKNCQCCFLDKLFRNNIPNKNNQLITFNDNEKPKIQIPEKRKAEDLDQIKDLKKAKLETKALKAKRPGFTDERYQETSYYFENGLRKVYPYYFTFTTFTKGRWVGEKILDVFVREFRVHSKEEYERCIKAGALRVNYEKVPVDYRLKHNDLLENMVHRHEVPVTSQPIRVVHMDDDIVVVNKPASIPVHPCGRYRHNTVVFILAKEYNLKNLHTIHRLDRLTSGLLLFGRGPKKARQMEQQIRNREVQKEYICRVEGNFPEEIIECNEPIEVVSYKIGVCKVSPKGKDCRTTFQKISYNGKTSVVLCKPLTGRMHQIRVHLQYLGYPVVNDPLYNHTVFGPLKGRGGDIGGKTDEELVRELINIHNAENWLGIDGEVDAFKLGSEVKGHALKDDDLEITSRETSPTCPSNRQCINIDTPNKTNETQVVQHKNTGVINITNQTVSESNSNIDVNDGRRESCSHIKVEVTVATQTGHESPDITFNAEKMTSDQYCYECKVRYRDPKPKDLVMYLHAWKYKGPGWEYETELPNWGSANWSED